MKFFGTDFALKYVTFEVEGKTYFVTFRQSFLRGVHNVQVFKGSESHFMFDSSAKIKDTYPPIQARIEELVSLVERWLKHNCYWFSSM